MSIVSTFFGFHFRINNCCLPYYDWQNGLKPNAKIYLALDITVNTLRSFPFIILIIVLIPVTKMIVGTSIGTTAAIVPLTIGAAPFVARLIENSFKRG